MIYFLQETLNVNSPSLVIFVIITVKTAFRRKNKNIKQLFPSMQSQYNQGQIWQKQIKNKQTKSHLQIPQAYGCTASKKMDTDVCIMCWVFWKTVQRSSFLFLEGKKWKKVFLLLIFTMQISVWAAHDFMQYWPITL